MAETLDYARPPTCRSHLLALAAALTSIYPVLVVASLYGQWLLSWLVLGHPPRPSLDDPKHIDGANWMHGITAMMFLGTMPALMVALGLNALHAVWNRPSPRDLWRRAAAWGALLALLFGDPLGVLHWWLD